MEILLVLAILAGIAYFARGKPVPPEPVPPPELGLAIITGIKFAYSLGGSSAYYELSTMVEEAWRHRICICVKNISNAGLNISIKAIVTRPDNSEVECKGSLSISAGMGRCGYIDPDFKTIDPGSYRIDVEITAAGNLLDKKTYAYTLGKPTSYGSFSGTVRYSNGLPADDLTVLVSSIPTTVKHDRTNSAGEFSIPGIPLGTCTVEIGPPGGWTTFAWHETFYVDIQPGKNIKDFNLKHGGR